MSVPEDRQDPIYQGHRLRKRLRAAREAAGLTHTDVADALEWSPSKINRIETGKVGLAITDARVLLDLYGVTDPTEVQEITAMARAARQPSWWSPYRTAAAPELLRFVSYESSAIRIRNFQSTLVPGLLQTEEYAKQILGESQEAEALLALRLERQDRVLRTGGPDLHFILDEAAIRRVVGSERIMKEQFQKLITLNELENVDIKVVPFTAGLYPQFRSPYVLFQFPEEDEDLVAYLERPDGQVLLSERSPYTGANATDPTDYLDDYWFVERNVARALDKDFLFRDFQ
ncbi:Scr1 family TA system antitoxin-like transcriptional regulator [Streptomyces sp. NPDC008150]|uniref:helix-turn-helix domain-containing protein n=1 Tax=Streptomyces sp. NPDC008150 TaxID=3364816 RepID=UPI0036E90FB3